MEKQIMGYTDFKLKVDTEPDINRCMWVTLDRTFPNVHQYFDMSDDCVRRLRDACNEFLVNLESQGKDN